MHMCKGFIVIIMKTIAMLLVEYHIYLLVQDVDGVGNYCVRVIRRQLLSGRD